MWNKLYDAAVKVQNNRVISPFIEAGGVAAAILTKKGNIYVGVCIDTASTLQRQYESLKCSARYDYDADDEDDEDDY